MEKVGGGAKVVSFYRSCFSELSLLIFFTLKDPGSLNSKKPDLIVLRTKTRGVFFIAASRGGRLGSVVFFMVYLETKTLRLGTQVY